MTKIFTYDYDVLNMKLFSARRFQKGFTLIELLVVIGILGILAAALVATIDPFEQLKKADDSKIKNMAVEFQTANVRYYTTHGAFPWNDADNANIGAACSALSAGDISSILSAAGMLDCINTGLIAEGELKTGFAANTNDLAKIYVNWLTADQTNMSVCFSPTSKSQKAAAETNYLSDGTEEVGAVCPDANAADGDCYWCTR